MSDSDLIPLTKMVCKEVVIGHLEYLEVTGEKLEPLPAELPSTWPLGAPQLLIPESAPLWNRSLEPLQIEEPSPASLVLLGFIFIVLFIGITGWLNKRGK